MRKVKSIFFKLLHKILFKFLLNFFFIDEVKEISLSILEKSKMTIRKKECIVNTTSNNSYFNNFNNVQINSYVIVNRTHENLINTIEEDTTKNNYINDATIHSPTEKSNHEFLLT